MRLQSSKGRFRGRSAAVLAGLGLAAGWLSAQSVLAASAPIPDLSGVYWAEEYHPRIQVLGGGAPPLNAEGKAACIAAEIHDVQSHLFGRSIHPLPNRNHSWSCGRGEFYSVIGELVV